MSDKIKIERVAAYADGGTTRWIESSVKASIRTIEEAKSAQYYFVDNRFGSTTKGELFDRYPGDDGAVILNKENFEFL